jgi:hypothetical protein
VNIPDDGDSARRFIVKLSPKAVGKKYSDWFSFKSLRTSLAYRHLKLISNKAEWKTPNRRPV